MLAMDAIESFHVINLGCKVNKVESDGYSMQLLGFGLFQAPLEDAHLVVINTCAVTAEAEKKTRKTVRHAVASNNHARVVVTGCSSALHPEEYEAISPRVTVVSKPESTLFFNKMFPSCGHEAVISVPVGGGFRSRVGVKAEAMLRDAATRVAANDGRPVVLEAKGADCIAAAHAYAAEPQLFSSVRFTDAPPSWTEMATNPDPRLDSFAVAVWGALREYDWTDLIPKEVT